MYRSRRHAGLPLVRTAAAVLLFHGAAATAQDGLRLGDALRESLRLNPNVLLQQQQVMANRGAELQAQGQFDPLLNATINRRRDLRPLRQDEKDAIARGSSQLSDPLAALLGLLGGGPAAATGPTVNRQATNTTSYSVGVEKAFQTGVALGTEVGVTSTSDNLAALNRIPPQSTGKIGFTVRAPLLRGAGTEATTANLAAAQAELDASRYDLVFANAQSLLGATLAYWDYVGRTQRLEIAREAETRARRLVEQMEKLIASDVVPAAERQLVLASYTERTAGRIAAEQALAEARRNLALQIGLPADRTAELPLPADYFPPFAALEPLVLERQLAALQALALAQRSDLEAARHRERAARRRLDLARNGLRPQADLSLGASYNSLLEQRAPFSPGHVLDTARVGPSLSATLAFQLPWYNHAARGAFMVQSAALASSLVRIRNLADTIGTSVWIDAQGLTRSAQQLAQNVEATRHYRLTVENERTKHRLGLSTLIDVINLEDRLTGALLAEIQAHQAYASAIAQLRFDVGGIVVQQDEQFDVPVEDLFSPRFDVSEAVPQTREPPERALDHLLHPGEPPPR